jgi:hypothetical protein
MPVSNVNAETANNYQQYDNLQLATREQLAHPVVTGMLGEMVVKKFVSILDNLQPANLRGNRAIMPKKYRDSGYFAAILWPGGTIEFDPSIFNGQQPSQQASEYPASQEVELPDSRNIEDFGTVLWKVTHAEKHSFRSNPVLVVDSHLTPQVMPSVFVHEMTHVMQCTDTPTAYMGSFDEEGVRFREELEAYHRQATFDNARIRANIVDAESIEELDKPRVIDFARSKVKHPLDPFRPSSKLMSILNILGIQI